MGVEGEINGKGKGVESLVGCGVTRGAVGVVGAGLGVTGGAVQGVTGGAEGLGGGGGGVTGGAEGCEAVEMRVDVCTVGGMGG